MKKVFSLVLVLMSVVFIVGCGGINKSQILSKDFREKVIEYDEKLDDLTDIYLENEILEGNFEKIETDIMNIMLLAADFKNFESEVSSEEEQEVYDAMDELMVYTAMLTKPTIDAITGRKVDSELSKQTLAEYEKKWKEKDKVFKKYGL